MIERRGLRKVLFRVEGVRRERRLTCLGMDERIFVKWDVF